MPSSSPECSCFVTGYPPALATAGQRALYDNLGEDEAVALAVDAAVIGSRQDSWRTNAFKVRKVRLAIIEALRAHGRSDDEAAAILELVTNQRGY